MQVAEFMMHLLPMEAWEMGEKLSCNEQTKGFKGMHKDKQQITYKAEGNGFLCNALCQDGYTYSFYFHNQPPPAHYISHGFSPLHSWVLFVFDQLKHKYHIVGLDNLFMSTNLFCGAFCGKNKVKIHGVTRKVSWGIPNSVRQDEETNPYTADLKQGTVKATVLERDADCPSLVAFPSTTPSQYTSCWQHAPQSSGMKWKNWITTRWATTRWEWNS